MKEDVNSEGVFFCISPPTIFWKEMASLGVSYSGDKKRRAHSANKHEVVRLSLCVIVCCSFH